MDGCDRIELQACHNGRWFRVGEPFDDYPGASVARGRLIAGHLEGGIDGMALEDAMSVMLNTRVVRLGVAEVLEEG